MGYITDAEAKSLEADRAGWDWETKPQCGNCKYFVGFVDEDGVFQGEGGCKRYPTTLYKKSEDLCGEHLFRDRIG